MASTAHRQRVDGQVFEGQLVDSQVFEGQPPSGRILVDGACLDSAGLGVLRAKLVRRCLLADGSGERAVRDAVDAAVGPLTDAGPLVDVGAVQSASDQDLVWCTQAVQRALNMLEGARSALTAETVRRRLPARRGEATGAETLVNATSVGGALARRIERDAQTVHAQPPVADALGRGEINADQAAVVAGAIVPDTVRSELCQQAKHQTADQTRRSVLAAEAASRQESDAQRLARQRAARSASMWIDANDGMWHLRAKFDALTGDAINRRFVRAIQRHWRSDKDRPASQRRSVPQRAADALAALLSEPQGNIDATGSQGSSDAIGSAPSSAEMIVVTTLDNLRRSQDCPGANEGADARASSVVSGPSATPAHSLRASRDELCEGVRAGSPGEGASRSAAATTATTDLLSIAGAAAITENATALTAADLRRIACDARVIPIVMGGASEVLDVGRATRTVPAAIRRALIARDQGCVWPGCDRAAVHCDAHHIEHWVHNGPTSLDNLALLCHSHHQRLHEYDLVLHPPWGSAPNHHNAKSQQSCQQGWSVTPAPTRSNLQQRPQLE